MTAPNPHAASDPLHRDWPTEAGEIVGRIESAISIKPGSYMGRVSMAASVGKTDLKTELRRLYSALGGVRSHYDPNADELRALYAGTVTAASLMAKAGSPSAALVAPNREAKYQAPEAVTEPTPAEIEAAGEHFGPAVEAAMAEQVKPAKRSLTKAGGDPSAVAAMLAQLLASPQIDEEAVRQIVDDATAAKLATVEQSVADALATVEPKLQGMIEAATRRVEITVANAPAIKIEQAHNMLEPVLKAVTAGVTPMLVGPAGSGKTTLARQIAEALNRPFYMAARVTSEYKLTGFIDAAGKAVQTDFRRAYEKGGVFLFDEIDASDADALTAFNAPLANDVADFPDGQVNRHPDFVAIAAGNTFGRGASREYVGRQQLDAATLDRFTVFEVDYDEALELAIAGNEDWTRYVQKVRKAVEREKVRAIVSPRASISGAKLLAAG
jgi:hypothetical protein